MQAESRLHPVALLSHWAGSLRTRMAMTDKHESESSEVEHVDHSIQEKGAVNARLVFACIVFGAASFMFGYDDKLISPVAALTGFVSYFFVLRQGRIPWTGIVGLTKMIFRWLNSKDQIQRRAC